MDINKLDIDRSVKKKLNNLLDEFKTSKIEGTYGKPQSFLDKLFS